MKAFKINIKVLLCGLIIFSQLMWMQTGILCPSIDGMAYMLLYYMKYIGTFILLLYMLFKPIKRTDALFYLEYTKLFIPLILIILLIQTIAFFNSPVIEIYQMSYVSRLIAQVLDKLCIIIMVGCVLLIAGEKAIDYLTTIFLFNELVLFVVTFCKMGISSIILPLFSGFGVQDAMESPLEVHELTYCMGLCLIYYLYFKPQKNKVDILKMCLLVFSVLLGGKRIAIFGIILSGLFCLFVYKKGLRKEALIIIGFGISALGMLYLLLLYNGEFFSSILKFNVNSMGRDVIYNYFTARTEFSPNFMGYGIASVSKMIENWTRADVGNMVVVKGLHNDILKLYVDIGFWGVIVWLWFNYIYLPIKYIKKYGKKCATLYMALSIYSFITYMTDNTEGYFVFQTVLFVLPLSFCIFNNKVQYKLLNR